MTNSRKRCGCSRGKYVNLLSLASAARPLPPGESSVHPGLGLPSIYSAILLTLPLSHGGGSFRGGIAAVSFAADGGGKFLNNGGLTCCQWRSGSHNSVTTTRRSSAKHSTPCDAGTQFSPLGTDPGTPRGEPDLDSQSRLWNGSQCPPVQWPSKLVFRIIDKVKRAINHRWVQLSVDRLHRTPLGHAQLSEAAVTSIEGYLRKGADFMRMNPVKWTESKQNQAAIWTRVKGERNYQYPRSSRRIIGAWLKKLSGRRTLTRG
ncbi:hypothetical protein MJO28_009667 [Puccinia striiformis f. sp. tritici]|uniref:Uncharacterized protein n=1 Tax=Puccinia striiformis f. sp. tritici TaxID=168172 RepID=A0ACC0E7X2_9BASI|nr:hypothetical protein MJO28_009667 [Puccinia striiformis f. sp. tritici]KAI7950792.1 hypothetical protein MJO29_009466 [Puccinia striiformis f. sp. tritici]